MSDFAKAPRQGSLARASLVGPLGEGLLGRATWVGPPRIRLQSDGWWPRPPITFVSSRPRPSQFVSTPASKHPFSISRAAASLHLLLLPEWAVDRARTIVWGKYPKRVGTLDPGAEQNLLPPRIPSTFKTKPWENQRCQSCGRFLFSLWLGSHFKPGFSPGSESRRE